FALLAFVAPTATILEARAVLDRMGPRIETFWDNPDQRAIYIEAMIRGAGAPVQLCLELGCALCIAFAAAAFLRLRRTARLSDALASLPPRERAAALLPLHGDRSGDTRKIAAALAAQLRAPSEITPAAAPDAHGGEPSPAETDQ